MELVVLSGKGGTGKTTIATALSELAGNVIRIDCDVDAPNFYLIIARVLPPLQVGGELPSEEYSY